MALCLTAALSPAQGQTPPAKSKPFVIATDADGALDRYGRLAYTEAFRRMGIPLAFEMYPLARRSAIIAEGLIDGEGSRVAAYADAHPELIRVEESIVDVKFSLFGANPTLHAKRIEELPANALVEYRRGILMCEKILKAAIPPARLSDIISTEQGLRKLLTGRSDVYCDIDPYVGDVLRGGTLQAPENVRKLFEITSLPTYPYLARKHADLALRLAATLKEMKAEGLLDRYGREAGLNVTGLR